MLMKKISNLLLLLILILVFSCNSKNSTTSNSNVKFKGSTDQLKTLFLSQGIIKVYEPLKVLIGESDSAAAIYNISLLDIEKYHGKVCPGIATGFKMFQAIIDSLYPETGIAIRGQVAVACSKGNDMLDVAGYIFGIRTNTCCGRGELGKGMLLVDTSLSTGVKKQFVMIFKRLDNGLEYKVTFNKFKLMEPNQWPFIDETLHKFEHGGQLTLKERKEFAQMVHQAVINVLKNGPNPGTFKIERITNYTFPCEK